jgi:hypothetical protein
MTFLEALYGSQYYEIHQKGRDKADAFMQYPDEVKKKANAKLLIPFFILGLIVFGLVMSKL